MFQLIDLQGLTIFEQLQFEEALLRTSSGNFCLLNTEAPPAIVLGISGKVEKLLHINTVRARHLPVIRRFSGGGTVYTDENTLFVTFIVDAATIPCESFPKPILTWAEKVLSPFFPPLFRLHDNDFVLGLKKCGGNAQYIQKGRWLIHTSFLWDFDPLAMEEVLLIPEKQPAYRQNRTHTDFLTPLHPHFPNKHLFLHSLKHHLKNHLAAHERPPPPLSSLPPHRSSLEQLII